jgi:type IV pilus biogenesis protein CpaD/CtpE
MMMARLELPVIAVLLAASFAALAGCTSGPNQSRGTQWIEEDEAQKRRLEAAGFPQYIGE